MDSKIKFHPVYTDYCATMDGEIFSVKKQKSRKEPVITQIKQGSTPQGYRMFNVYDKHEGKKGLFSHRFIWECWYGRQLLDGYREVIDHINDKVDDNRINNLQLMTQRQNILKRSKRQNVYKTDSGKWKVAMKVNGKTRYFGVWEGKRYAQERAKIVEMMLHLPNRILGDFLDEHTRRYLNNGDLKREVITQLMLHRMEVLYPQLGRLTNVG